MKKLFTMLLMLFSFYLIIQIFFDLFSPGDEYIYEITVGNIDFEIEEISNFKGKLDNYMYNIKANESVFSFQIFNNYDKKTKILTDIKYFKNGKYECIFPIFIDNLNLSDVMCLNNDILYYYNTLKGSDTDLDKFVSELPFYNNEQFIDKSSKTQIEGVYVYKDNLIKNHYIGLNNYKGIYDISSNFNSVVYNITLFKKDVYNQKLSVFTDEFYLAADYNQEYKFNKINVVNLVELDAYTIVSDKEISIDSYIQGVIDNVVYLYDKDNKIQYEIDIEKKSILQYSSKNIKYYNNGEWTTMSVADANNELKFKTSNIDYENKQYDRIDKVGEETGYYYLYKNNGNKYDVYRINIQNKSGLTYLFSTKKTTAISYVDNYVYFLNGNKAQVFNDGFGIKTLIEYNELEFNKNINFNVYSK